MPRFKHELNIEGKIAEIVKKLYDEKTDTQHLPPDLLEHLLEFPFEVIEKVFPHCISEKNGIKVLRFGIMSTNDHQYQKRIDIGILLHEFTAEDAELTMKNLEKIYDSCGEMDGDVRKKFGTFKEVKKAIGELVSTMTITIYNTRDGKFEKEGDFVSPTFGGMETIMKTATWLCANWQWMRNVVLSMVFDPLFGTAENSVADVPRETPIGSDIE